jgi:cob(I)alamin adenosyltransferase
MTLTTKKGDDGRTKLLGGKEVLKSDPRVEFYGGLDELDAHLGLVRALLRDDKLLELAASSILSAQKHLHAFTALASCPVADWSKYHLISPGTPPVRDLEEYLEKMEADLPELDHFVIPGDSLVSAQVHIARTVCRRMERAAVAFLASRPGEWPQEGVAFLNRLSDFLFALARWTLKQSGRPETV